MDIVTMAMVVDDLEPRGEWDMAQTDMGVLLTHPMYEGMIAVRLRIDEWRVNHADEIVTDPEYHRLLARLHQSRMPGYLSLHSHTWKSAMRYRIGLNLNKVIANWAHNAQEKVAQVRHIIKQAQRIERPTEIIERNGWTHSYQQTYVRNSTTSANKASRLYASIIVNDESRPIPMEITFRATHGFIARTANFWHLDEIVTAHQRSASHA